MRLIAEGRGDRASIAEITEEADIGFGSFYNHFDSKDQLFQTASEEVLERTRPTLSGGHLGIIVLDAPGDSPLAPGRAWAAPRLEVS
ncbi:MAG: TetR/AcrR family transcriptional regulator, partial [Streptosporangiaceae bacterium]